MYNSQKINKLKENGKSILFSLLSIIISMILAVFFIVWSNGEGFFESFKIFLKSVWDGSLGNVFGLSETLVYSTIYIFTGIAHMISFKTNLFNIGVEGQFIAGMIGALMVGIIPGIPPLVHIILILLAGIISGGLWAFLPAYLKVKFNSNEVVNTIMMNFIALHLMNLLVGTILQDKGYNSSYSILPSGMLPRLFSDVSTRANFGIFIAIILAIVVYFFINKTKAGYELRSVGFNQYASEYGGIDVKKSIMMSIIISGIIAGMGGSVFVSGVQHRLPKLGSFLNYGFDGITVTLVARNNPIVIILTSFLFGALNASALELQFNGIPKDVVFLIQAIIIIFISGEYLFKYIINKFNDKKSRKGGAI